MNSFGDCLGHSIIVDQHIYTYTGNDLLILDSSTMKTLQRIDVGASILQIGIHSELQILTNDCQIHYYTLDGKQARVIRVFTDVHTIECPVFVQEYLYFVCPHLNQICKFNHKLEKVADYSINDENRITRMEYHKNTQSLIAAAGTSILQVKQDSVIILKSMNRQFCSLALNQQDLIAVGDDRGTLIILKLENMKAVITMQEQWHAHPINVILFNGECLYTAGKEGVIVQWHLSVARKAFFARQGGEIVAMAVGQEQNRLVVNVKSVNQVRQVALMGQNELPHYVGIQHNDRLSNIITFDNKIITNGISGQLQVINPTTGLMLYNIDICKKNYVSDIDTGIVRDHRDITHFAFIDRHLICVVQSSVLTTLYFYEQIDNVYQQISVGNYPQQVDGISTFKNNDGITVVTYGQGSVRLWKQVQNKKGLLQWNCVFHGEGYKNNKILSASCRNNGSIMETMILTQDSVMFINSNNNKINSEIPLDTPINSNNPHILTQSHLVIGQQTQLSIVDFNTQQIKQLKLKINRIIDIIYISEQLTLIQVEQKQHKQYMMVYDHKLSKIKQITAIDQSDLQVFSISLNNSYVIYGRSKQSNQYYKLLTLELTRKASFFNEIEIESKQQETIIPLEQPTLTNNTIQADSNNLKRLVLAQQSRSIKSLNLNEYFNPQSHMLPSLSVVSRRIMDVMNQPIEQSTKPVQLTQMEVEQSNDQQIQTKDNSLLYNLKKQFKEL